MKQKVTGIPQRPASETIERPKARVAPRVYAMAQEEPDLADVSRGTISIYNTFEYVLIDPIYEMKEDRYRTSWG